MYNGLGTQAYPKERLSAAAAARGFGSFSCLARQREVMPVFMTWDVFFTFCMLIVSVIGLVIEVFNKR